VGRKADVSQEFWLVLATNKKETAIIKIVFKTNFFFVEMLLQIRCNTKVIYRRSKVNLDLLVYPLHFVHLWWGF
jgi:hypothetical protein